MESTYPIGWHQPIIRYCVTNAILITFSLLLRLNEDNLMSFYFSLEANKIS